MTQSDRNWLYAAAYALDHKPRIRVPERSKFNAAVREVTDRELDKARVREETTGLYILFTEAELSKLTDDIRALVSKDEMRNSR